MIQHAGSRFTIPGALTAAPISSQPHPRIPQMIQNDTRHCVSSYKPHQYDPERRIEGNFVHAAPAGTFLCAPGNPVFDVRICTYDGSGCHLIWEQLRHKGNPLLIVTLTYEELDSQPRARVTTTMIDQWYIQAKGVVRGEEYCNPPLLVYITNRELEPYLTDDRNRAEFLSSRPDLAIITRHQLCQFLPPCLLYLVLSVE